MKIYVVASKHRYDTVPEVTKQLEARAHIVTPPNGFGDPDAESSQRPENYVEWKQEMLRMDRRIVSENDAVLVLNHEKNGQKSYIGGSVLLEIYTAWTMGKKIFLMNPIPDNMLRDEIRGLAPVVLNGDLSKIK